MKFRVTRIIISVLVLVVGATAFLNQAFSSSKNTVYVAEIVDAPINPVTAEYISKAIHTAHDDQAHALIIKLDTPGGLLNTTRLIVREILDAPLPVVVYIAPGGSRAGSAGVFITYASHVAAMAPSTNIGAAHPVQMGGRDSQDKPGVLDDLVERIKSLEENQDESENENLKNEDEDSVDASSKENKENKEKAVSSNEVTEDDHHESAKADEASENTDENDDDKKDLVNKDDDDEGIVPDDSPMSSKILNDTVAFVKALAELRGRNVDWAIKSVTKSDSITNQEALDKGVVEIVAENLDDLLTQLDGRTVSVQGKDVVLATKDAQVKTFLMGVREKILGILTDPNIAYLLMMLGFYGLLYEVTHPGFGVPGIMGVIFLILSFYSMQTLPVNYAGIALIALAIILFIAEAVAPGIGLLALGGVISMLLGSLMLFDSDVPMMRVSISLIMAFTGTTAAITIFLIRSVLKSRQAKVQGGAEGLIGSKGIVEKEITPPRKGKVFAQGALWNASADEALEKGVDIEVVSMDGFLLHVKKREA